MSVGIFLGGGMYVYQHWLILIYFRTREHWIRHSNFAVETNAADRHTHSVRA